MPIRSKKRSSSLPDRESRTLLANEQRYQKAKLAEVAAQAYKRAYAEFTRAVEEFERTYAKEEIQPPSPKAKPKRQKKATKMQPAGQEKPRREQTREAEPIPSGETPSGQFEQFNQQSFMELTNE